MATSNHSRLRWLALVAATLLCVVFSPISAQLQNERQKKVLVLHLMRKNDSSTLANERTYQQVLSEGLTGHVDYYSEYVDLARFGASDYQSALRDFFKQKYKGTHFDLIIATTADLKNFLMRYSVELFANTPVVFSASDMVVDNTIPPNLTGIVYETDLCGTLDIIRTLQPTVRRVFVVSGASQAVDKWHEARARKQFQDYSRGLEFIYLSGLPTDELKRRLSNLAPDSVVYFLIMVEDGSGKRFDTTSGLDQIVAASSVPIYTWYDGYLGHGVVGGKLASSQNVAIQTAQLALRILRGEAVENIPITKADTSRLAFDWRQLQRWQLDEDRLPATAEILYRETTFWNRYKFRIIGIAALFALQFALIVTLLVERRRRRKANVEMKESEERYRNVVETQTDLICRFLPDSTLTFVNDAYCKYFSKTARELVGTKFVQLIPESERDWMLRFLEGLVQNPTTVTHEHPVILLGGIYGWQQWTNRVISSGSGPNIELQGVGRDISQRKELEQQLVRSEREFSTLVENSPDVICRLDRDLRYIYVSPNLRRIFSTAAEMSLGKRPDQVGIADYDWNGFEAECRSAIEKRQATVLEFEYRGRHYRTRIIPEFAADGGVESVMTVTEDFTERLRSERELRKLTARLIDLQDEERRRIARELHDGTAQSVFAITLNLRRVEKTAAIKSPEIAGMITDSLQLAEQSLSELRTLSYLLHPPALDHAGLVRALQWFVRGFSERSGIQVDTSALQDIGRLPQDVEIALFRIVQESLGNVRRHSGSETASILLEKGSGEVKLQISDSGHGMVEGTEKGSGGENGELGVGISGMRQRLIQLGGRLEIESSGNGTTITVIVPTLEQQVLSRRSGNTP